LVYAHLYCHGMKTYTRIHDSAVYVLNLLVKYNFAELKSKFKIAQFRSVSSIEVVIYVAHCKEKNGKYFSSDIFLNGR
jgi:hypothetical protein